MDKIFNLPSSSTSTSTIASTAPSMTSSSSFLQNRTIEEIISKWSQDLDTHLRIFRSKALELSEIDDALIDQGKKIAELHKDTVIVEGLTKELTLNLDFLESQQSELEQTLSKIEDELSKYYEKPPPLLSADIERDKIFTLAENLGLEISKLKDGVEDVFRMTTRSLSESVKEDDSGVDLLKILESQLSIHNWATENISTLKKKIDKLSPK